MTTDTIWRDYSSQMKSYISSQISDENTANDILQNVFLKIHSDILNIKKIGNLKSWLYTMTKNTIIDYYRSLKQNSDITDNIADDNQGNNNVLDNIALSIKFFINQLDEPYKETMILSEIREMSQIEIAKKLGIPYSTIKSRVQRGRLMVKDMMLDCCHYEFDRKGNVYDYECRNC